MFVNHVINVLIAVKGPVRPIYRNTANNIPTSNNDVFANVGKGICDLVYVLFSYKSRQYVASVLKYRY